MPLFELYQMTKEKLDSAKQKNPSSSTDLSLEPENDLIELVWENGQILKQGQSSRTKKSPTSNSLPSYCLPSHTPKNRDKDLGKTGKFGTVDAMLNGIQMSDPSGEMGLNQDDDMVPWLNYAVDESLQQDYCSDFLHELSGVTGNELSSHNNFASFDKRSSSNQFDKEFNSVFGNHGARLEHGNVSKVSSVGGGEATRPRSSTNPLYTSSSRQCQTSFPNLRSGVSDSTSNGIKNSTDNGIFQGSNLTATGNLSGLKLHKQDQRLSTNNSGVMNFSHFARPVALVRANLQNIGSMPGARLSRIERMGSKDKSSVASRSPVESPVIDSSGCLRKESSCQPAAVTSKVDVKPQEAKFSEQPVSEPPEAACREDALNNDKKPSQVHAESATKGVVESEKTVEPVAAASSVCSGNSVERASDDLPHNVKRKHCDLDDSECPSEEQDVEEESVGVKKQVPGRVGTGSKRSRAAEVHNLSERRRRDRINEKMRALQELIPNCNKVDKASMLDEAIEYLKTLQLQVQIMSMGAGFYMPPMMYPLGMQHMHAANMAHFPPVGIGMGMGVGYGMGMPDINGGSSCYPMVQVPAMHGAHFPGTSVSGPSALQGMAGSNFQLLGLPAQGHPMSMPHAPLNPLSGGLIMKSAMGLNPAGMVGSMDNTDAAKGSTSKDLVQNVNSQVKQNTGAKGPVDQASGQCEATNEGSAEPAAVQDNGQASEVNGLVTYNSSRKNGNESSNPAFFE